MGTPHGSRQQWTEPILGSRWSSSRRKVLLWRCRKPRLGASLDEYNRYVHDKYIRKKFVTDKSAVHPLTAYLNGNYTQPQVQNKEKKESIVPVKPVPQAKLELPRDITGADKANKPKSANFNLLDEDHSEFSSQNNRSDNLNTHSEGHEEKTNNKKDFSNISEPDDEFDDYVEAVDQVPNNQDQMRFDDLFKNPKPNNQPPNPTTHSVGGFPQHNYYGQNFTPNNGMMQHNLHPNMVGMNHMNHMNPNLARHHSAQQQIYGQNNLAHNPYVGYAPHSGHPQGNPHSLSPQPTQQYPQYSNFTLNWLCSYTFHQSIN